MVISSGFVSSPVRSAKSPGLADVAVEVLAAPAWADAGTAGEGAPPEVAATGAPVVSLFSLHPAAIATSTATVISFHIVSELWSSSVFRRIIDFLGLAVLV